MNNRSLPLVHVVVLNYNGMRFLKDCFDSLRTSTYGNTELVLLDNLSTDESVSFIQSNYPEVRIIQTGKNAGYSKAYNLAFEQCKGEYLVMLNNDVKVRPDWIEPMVKEAEGDHKIAAIAPKLLYMNDLSMFEYAGACGGHMDKYGYPFARGRVFFTLEKDQGQYEQNEDIFWATGAAMFIRLSALEKCGNLDADFVHHMEEIDLCWRMQLAGFKLRVVPASIVEHYGGATIVPDSFKKTYWNHRNSIFMLFKNVEGKNLPSILLKHLFLDAMAASWYACNFKLNKVYAVLTAHVWIFVHLPMLWRNRKDAQSKRSVSDEAISKMIFPKSIAIRYFLFGEKTYKQLIKNIS